MSLKFNLYAALLVLKTDHEIHQMKKIIRRSASVLLILFLLVFLLDSCMQFRMSDKRMRKKFKEILHQVKIDTYKAGDYSIRYVEVGEEDKPMILFVHGAPGSSQDFISYLQDTELVARARMIAVDRPGYGYSCFGKTCTSIEQQAACIAPILRLNKNDKPVLLVGHSYGGPIVLRLAMDYPDIANGSILLLAPAIDPDNEKKFWFNKPFSYKGLRWILPRSFRVANDEKITHSDELRLMLPFWDSLKNRTVYVHGHKDWIVNIKNSVYGLKKMPNAVVDSVFLPDMDHLMIWNRYSLVKDQLLKLLKE